MISRFAFYWVLPCLSLCFSAHGENLIEAATGRDINQAELLKEHALNAGDWMSMGGAYYKDNPNNHIDSPTSFNDRSGEFQLNQLNLFLQKAMDLESRTWNVGGRVDVMFGTDSRFIQAMGLDDKLMSGISAFMTLPFRKPIWIVFAPIGNGVTAKIGHFYMIIRHEVVTAPNNFFTPILTPCSMANPSPIPAFCSVMR